MNPPKAEGGNKKDRAMIRRTMLFFLVASFSIALISFKDTKAPEATNAQKVVKTIIIDAGHGGSDGGARGVYSSEKDICLDISLKLEKVLAEQLPGVKLLQTRTTDTYPALHSRANFANSN